MPEIIKSLKFGVVNFIGITIPGFLFLFFIELGLVLPILQLLSAFGVDSSLSIEDYRIETVFLTTLAAYLVGYFFRLIDMQKYDIEKAKKLQDEGKKLKLPIEDNNDKYPYLNYKKYLDVLGYQKLKKYIIWDDENRLKLSRSHIIFLKQYIALKSPLLNDKIEALEAHIRLIFGIAVISLPGIIISSTGIVISTINLLISIPNPAKPEPKRFRLRRELLAVSR